MKEHRYTVRVDWTGNDGEGTRTYRSYRRDHEIRIDGKQAPIPGSSDPAFRGDPSRYNPEELLVASLSSCHMLWYLHFCAVNQVNVIDYRDEAVGVMEEEDASGAGQFRSVVLRPVVTVTAESVIETALQLHEEAHAHCFIARSVRFPVRVEPTVRTA